MAVASLVLAISSFFFCPLVLSVVALAMIPSSRRTVVASGGGVGGLGILTADKVVAWVNIGLVAVGVVGVIIVLIVGAASSTSSSSNAVAQLVLGF